MDELQHLEMCNSRSQLIRKDKKREANKEQTELLRTYEVSFTMLQVNDFGLERKVNNAIASFLLL